METTIWWIVIAVLGLIPMAFWGVYALLVIVRKAGDWADDLIRWGERNF